MREVVVPKWLSLLVLLVNKKHVGKCLFGKSGCFGCEKDDHNIRDCPTIVAKERETKQVAPSVPDGCAPNKDHIYVLRANGTNRMMMMTSVSYSLSL